MATAARRREQRQQQRHIAIAVDLSEESAFAVRWAVENYLRAGDYVVLLHVCPTPVLYGADWGSADPEEERKKKKSGDNEEEETKKKLDSSTTDEKVRKMGEPLERANIPFKVRVVKDHDMKERLCLEMERLSPSAVIMGSRGIGASSSASSNAFDDAGQGGLGSVSDYCVRHCVCPVVVVRHPNPKEAAEKNKDDAEPIVEMHSGSDLDTAFNNYFAAADDEQQNRRGSDARRTDA